VQGYLVRKDADPNLPLATRAQNALPGITYASMRISVMPLDASSTSKTAASPAGCGDTSGGGSSKKGSSKKGEGKGSGSGSGSGKTGSKGGEKTGDKPSDATDEKKPQSY
jgi:hypothetical protein